MSNRSFYGGQNQQYPVAGRVQGRGAFSDVDRGAALVPPVVQVRIEPLTRFSGDQVLAGGVGGALYVLTPDAAPPELLLDGVRGFRFVNVAGVVLANVNGGGYFTVLDRDTWDFVKVKSLSVQVAAAATATIQQWAE